MPGRKLGRPAITRKRGNPVRLLRWAGFFASCHLDAPGMLPMKNIVICIKTASRNHCDRTTDYAVYVGDKMSEAETAAKKEGPGFYHFYKNPGGSIIKSDSQLSTPPVCKLANRDTLAPDPEPEPEAEPAPETKRRGRPRKADAATTTAVPEVGGMGAIATQPEPPAPGLL
jgi:hypothetical protein